MDFYSRCMDVLFDRYGYFIHGYGRLHLTGLSVPALY